MSRSSFMLSAPNMGPTLATLKAAGLAFPRLRCPAAGLCTPMLEDVYGLGTVDTVMCEGVMVPIGGDMEPKRAAAALSTRASTWDASLGHEFPRVPLADTWDRDVAAATAHVLAMRADGERAEAATQLCRVIEDVAWKDLPPWMITDGAVAACTAGALASHWWMTRLGLGILTVHPLCTVSALTDLHAQLLPMITWLCAGVTTCAFDDTAKVRDLRLWRIVSAITEDARVDATVVMRGPVDLDGAARVLGMRVPQIAHLVGVPTDHGFPAMLSEREWVGDIRGAIVAVLWLKAAVGRLATLSVHAPEDQQARADVVAVWWLLARCGDDVFEYLTGVPSAQAPSVDVMAAGMIGGVSIRAHDEAVVVPTPLRLASSADGSAMGFLHMVARAREKVCARALRHAVYTANETAVACSYRALCIATFCEMEAIRWREGFAGVAAVWPQVLPLPRRDCDWVELEAFVAADGEALLSATFGEVCPTQAETRDFVSPVNGMFLSVMRTSVLCRVGGVVLDTDVTPYDARERWRTWARAFVRAVNAYAMRGRTVKRRTGRGGAKRARSRGGGTGDDDDDTGSTRGTTVVTVTSAPP